MSKILKSIVLLAVIFSQGILPDITTAYQALIHNQISSEAAKNSQRLKPALEEIGLLLSIVELKDVKIKTKDLNEWIQYGATWEDSIQIIWGCTQNILIKENIRYTGVEDARSNQLG